MSGVLTTKAACCASGNIDKCGVCDGKGDTCGSEIATTVTSSSPNSGRRLAQGASPPTSVSSLDVTLTNMTIVSLFYPSERVEVWVTDMGGGKSEVRACFQSKYIVHKG
jgi:hypothetical protein